MERIILFPKVEFQLFNEGKKNFNESNYQKAISLFNKALSLKYIKSDCIKYIIDCYIELHNYDEVYKIIENEFVDKNVSEDYLLRKYLYTMVVDELYIEANEIINIYKQNKVISNELEQFLDEMLIIINNKLNEKNVNQTDMFRKYLTSSRFEDHMQIILNLEQLDYDKLKKEISTFLLNNKIDCFVKYNLLKYLFDNKLVKILDYRNYFNEQFIIKEESFINLLEDKRFIEPINMVNKNIENDYAFATPFIKNIWLDYCVNHYPKILDDINLASCLLNVLIYKSINIQFNINNLCKQYNINSKALFQYF